MQLKKLTPSFAVQVGFRLQASFRGNIMKTRLILLLLITSTITGANADFLGSFTNWDDVVDRSPDIVIVQCESPYHNNWEFPNGMLWADVKVLKVLKGKSKQGKTKIVTKYSLQQGCHYLIIGEYRKDRDRLYYAAEDWRVIPLEPFFPEDNILNGMALKEQIRMMFDHRLKVVTEELKRAETEKKRLEEALKGKH